MKLLIIGLHSGERLVKKIDDNSVDSEMRSFVHCQNRVFVRAKGYCLNGQDHISVLSCNVKYMEFVAVCDVPEKHKDEVGKNGS